jgi:single-strand DNA-binding protein
MNFKITGKVHAMMDTKQVSERFSKREFVVEVEDGKYPQMILFQVTNDKISQADSLQAGDSVAVEFNLRGREWKSPNGETKYFVSCDAWRIENQSTERGASKLADDLGPGNGPDSLPF